MENDNQPFHTIKEELELEKLRGEIANLKKPFYKNASFWTIFPPICTLLIASYATCVTLKSGIFDLREREIRLSTLILSAKRDSLNQQITGLEIGINDLKGENSNLIEEKEILKKEKEKLSNETSKLSNEKSKLKVEVDATKLAYEKLVEERFKTQEIIKETKNLVAELRDRKKKMADDIQEHHQNIARDTGLPVDKRTQSMNSFVIWQHNMLQNDYEKAYEGKIFILRKKLLEIFKREQIKYSPLSLERYTTDEIVKYHIVEVIDELEIMANLLHLETFSDEPGKKIKN